MRNKEREPLWLEGHGVVLEEICPRYFAQVIAWRNNPTLNRFLNQPGKLTIEDEAAWYHGRYLKDDTQGFLVMVDKENGVPFGTFGWTALDGERRQCIAGRLLLGDPNYRNSGPFLESFFLHGDYLYQFVDRMYAHIGVKNRKAIHLNKLLGYRLNDGGVQYPAELFVQGDRTRPQREYVRTREDYEKARKVMFVDIFDSLYES